ncbi:hypothetical protein ACP4OV_012940 [Aristida adscensionis]
MSNYPYSTPPPPPANYVSTNHEYAILFAVIGTVVVTRCLCWMCPRSIEQGEHQGGASASPGRRPPEPGDDHRHASDGSPRRTGGRTAPVLPAFAYSRSVQHKVTGAGAGEEAATCSVCLGVFQSGEIVRLLPLCMHLFHIECIDPWLASHPTCPICRSEADATRMVDVDQPPPV